MGESQKTCLHLQSCSTFQCTVVALEIVLPTPESLYVQLVLLGIDQEFPCKIRFVNVKSSSARNNSLKGSVTT